MEIIKSLLTIVTGILAIREKARDLTSQERERARVDLDYVGRYLQEFAAGLRKGEVQWSRYAMLDLYLREATGWASRFLDADVSRQLKQGLENIRFTLGSESNLTIDSEEIEDTIVAIEIAAGDFLAWAHLIRSKA